MQSHSNEDSILPIINAWRDAWEAIDKNSSAHIPTITQRFVDYAWDDFKPRICLDILLSETAAYKALKPILFSGLCTWVACPNQTKLRKKGMLLIGIKHLKVAEHIGRAAFGNRDLPNQDLLGDIMGRLRGLGPEFYTDFYYPVGGLDRFIKLGTPKSFRKKIASEAASTRIIASMMQIFDFHAKNLSNKIGQYPPSNTKGIELARTIYGLGRKEIPIDYGKIDAVWKSFYPAASLVYAASTIALDKNESLLSKICQGKASFEKHGHLLKIWISRARYASETILANHTVANISETSLAQLPNLPSDATPEPEFSTSEQAKIRAEFDMVAILKSRRPNEKRTKSSRRGPRRA